MAIRCGTCNSTEVEVDDKLGHTVCVVCGQVVEENNIVSEVTFTETSKGGAIADGFQISSNQARASHKGTFGLIRTGSIESREQTIQNGHRRIQEIANQPQIRMSERLVQSALRFFNVAVVNNFTKGRKANNVVAACLYLVCRLEKTAHMLIDFADALSTNVFQLGATFLALVQLANVKLPLVDPSLYISRFAARLDFGDATPLVIRDANRLAQRMNRDWIQTGRRPAGICAASLFIAARMHGFVRTTREIILVVKICQGTLRRRLAEFEKTPSSHLSVNDFQTIWLEEEKDPPSYTDTRKREHRLETDDKNIIRPKRSPSKQDGSVKDDKEEENHVDEEKEKENAASILSSLDKQEWTEEDLEQEEQAAKGTEYDTSGLGEEVVSILHDQETKQIAKMVRVSLDDNAGPGSIRVNTPNSSTASLDDQQDRLSDLDDDDDVQAMLDVTPEEVEFKRQLWMDENQDWLLKQEAKKAQMKESKDSIERRKAAKKKRKRESLSFPQASSAAEAAKNYIMSKPALSKKINYDVLDNLFEGGNSAENESASKRLASLGVTSVTGIPTMRMTSQD